MTVRFIKAILYVEDTCNPSDNEALKYVEEMLSEAFGKEEMQEFPRCKLVMMKVSYDS